MVLLTVDNLKKVCYKRIVHPYGTKNCPAIYIYITYCYYRVCYVRIIQQRFVKMLPGIPKLFRYMGYFGIFVFVPNKLYCSMQSQITRTHCLICFKKKMLSARQITLFKSIYIEGLLFLRTFVVAPL